MGNDTILQPFGLKSASDGEAFVFSSPLITAADEIRRIYRSLDYDHRPYVPERDRDYKYIMTEQFRRGYACFKYAVAKVLQPRTICEIGTGSGVAARAFLSASPKALYVGVDDGSKDEHDGFPFMQHVDKVLSAGGFNHQMVRANSQELDNLPQFEENGRYDLVHVDGDHSEEGAYHDVKISLDSLPVWILIDDARDAAVVRGAIRAIADRDTSMTWAYFEDTWTGSILLWRGFVK